MLDINEFENAIKINKKLIKAKEKELSSITKEKYELISSVDILKEVRLALTEISKRTRERAIDVIGTTVENMIKSILDDRYGFEIELITFNNKPFVKFYLTENVDGVISKQDIVDDSGGGAQDIVATALRYAFLLTISNGIKGPLILDEPARMVDDNGSDEYAMFLDELSKVSKKQIIMCTHNENIKRKASNVIEIVK